MNIYTNSIPASDTLYVPASNPCKFKKILYNRKTFVLKHVHLKEIYKI